MQKTKKIPMRQCIGCKERKEKFSMTRIIYTSDGTLECDLTGRKNGRGAYVCSWDCLEKAFKTGAFGRAFHINADEEQIGKLKRRMEGLDAAE